MKNIYRYFILGFHNSKEKDQKQNPAIFNHLNVSNAYIVLNTERYLEENLNIDFSVNNHTKPYEIAVIYYQSIYYGSQQFPFTIDDFKELYPLLDFDVSKQREGLKNSPIDIRIRVSFKEARDAVESECYVYALILSDELITLESDENNFFLDLLKEVESSLQTNRDCLASLKCRTPCQNRHDYRLNHPPRKTRPKATRVKAKSL